MFIDNTYHKPFKELLSIFKKKKIFDIYFIKDFIELHTKTNQDIKYFFYTDDKDYFIMPIIVHLIKITKKKLFYFETVYGYSGPLSTSINKKFLNKVWNNFNFECKNQNIISGLIRFNPFLKNHKFALNQNFIDIVKEKKILISKIDHKYDYYYSRFNQNVKLNLAKSNKLNFNINNNSTSLERIKKFHKIYKNLMLSKSADKQYMFDENYFINLFKKCSENVGFLDLDLNGSLVGGLIYLKYDKLIHIHLSAISKEYRNYGLSYLLRSYLFNQFESSDITINFGGGLTSEEDDSLYKFKSNFTQSTLDYFIGKVIIDKDNHNLLKEIIIQRYQNIKSKMHMPYAFV